MTTVCVPWPLAGACYRPNLGVRVFTYAPYAVFNTLKAIVDSEMAKVGSGLHTPKTISSLPKRKQKKTNPERGHRNGNYGIKVVEKSIGSVGKYLYP